MARIRTIKPEICVSQQFVELSTSARLLFVLSLCFFDDGGVSRANHRQLKMAVFPGDDFTIKEVEAWVNDILEQKLWEKFTHEGVEYWYVTGWKHQRIDKPTYKHPGPLNPRAVVEVSSNGSRTVDDHSTPESNGRESKGRETKGKENKYVQSGRQSQPGTDYTFAEDLMEFLNERGDRKFESYRKNKPTEGLKILYRVLQKIEPLTARQVIIVMADKWKDNPDMRDYLCPTTLFGRKSKLENYLTLVRERFGAAA